MILAHLNHPINTRGQAGGEKFMLSQKQFTGQVLPQVLECFYLLLFANRSVFMLQDYFGYNSVQLGINWYNSVQLSTTLF